MHIIHTCARLLPGSRSRTLASRDLSSPLLISYAASWRTYQLKGHLDQKNGEKLKMQKTVAMTYQFPSIVLILCFRRGLLYTNDKAEKLFKNDNA
jgi:hypothetical protein